MGLEYAKDDRPARSGPRLKILRIPAAAKTRYTLLGQVPENHGTHWDGQRTIPCTIPKAECKGCKEEFSYRWKCYLHAICWHSKEEGILELTQIMVEQIERQVSNAKLLRGVVIDCERGKGKQTRVRIEVVRMHNDQTDGIMIPEKVPEPYLRDVWELPPRKQRLKNDPPAGEG